MPAALEPRMTPEEIRQVGMLHTHIGALMSAQAAWRDECEGVRREYLSVVARAEKAEARVAELEALIAAGGAP